MSSEIVRNRDPVPIGGKCPHEYIPATHYPEVRLECQQTIKEEVPALFELASKSFLTKIDISVIPTKTHSAWEDTIRAVVNEHASERDGWEPIILEGGIFTALKYKVSEVLTRTYESPLEDTKDAIDNYLSDKKIIDSFSETYDYPNEPSRKVGCLGTAVSRGVITALALNYALMRRHLDHHISLIDENGMLRPRHELLNEFDDVVSSL